ncbi:hypothetical protein HMPREF0083_01028 [Aneurinibacillus aneurinilyticus ATCC 12856]|uniref:Uncharacterized protein n=2 Tax=Aneurinibacillus aneurinilyticus TaxID=1391 RepID=U1YJF7_ANEAE|nr:hypothetical protein HMPREF0083_01028 [Aneurinibacillus aneurinilyticus ATCC 12856]
MQVTEHEQVEQMDIFQLVQQPIMEPVPDKIYSPRELTEMGCKWTPKDEERWKAEIRKVYDRVRRETGRFINWFEAIEIYIMERDK